MVKPGGLLVATIAAALTAGSALAAAALASGPVARAAYAPYQQQCPQPLSAQRDPTNPLALPAAPGSNPLSGASFFTDGPAHGQVAKGIESLLGIDPTRFPDSYSWAQFRHDLDVGRYHARLARDKSLAYQVSMLEKIGDQPETERFTLYSGGGGPQAVFLQVQKIFCKLHKADPGSIPVFQTYFLYQYGYCETSAQILRGRAVFQRQVNEMAQAIGRRPAVALIEEDGIGSSSCMQQKGSLDLWLRDIKYEVDKLAALPHVVSYVEAGYSDAEPPGYTARALRQVDISKIRGFFTNDTHNNWTIDEIHWGERVIRLLGIKTHFIVNTANNGKGPLRPSNRVRNGNEVLCNPPGRGMGPRPTTSTGFPDVDAFLYTGVPGNSTGTCNGGPPSGTFWPARGVGEASRANEQLGPGYPSRPF